MKAAADGTVPFMDVVLAMKETRISELFEQIRLARGKLGALLDSLESADLGGEALKPVRERCDYLNAEIDEFVELVQESLQSQRSKK